MNIYNQSKINFANVFKVNPALLSLMKFLTLSERKELMLVIKSTFNIYSKYFKNTVHIDTNFVKYNLFNNIEILTLNIKFSDLNTLSRINLLNLKKLEIKIDDDSRAFYQLLERKSKISLIYRHRYRNLDNLGFLSNLLEKFKNLKELVINDMEYGNISKNIIFNIDSLESLTLYHLNSKGINIKNLSNLRQLKIHNDSYTNFSFSLLLNLYNLQELELEITTDSFEIPKLKIKKLYLILNKDNDISSIENLENLEELVLSLKLYYCDEVDIYSIGKLKHLCLLKLIHSLPSN